MHQAELRRPGSAAGPQEPASASRWNAQRFVISIVLPPAGPRSTRRSPVPRSEALDQRALPEVGNRAESQARRAPGDGLSPAPAHAERLFQR